MARTVVLSSIVTLLLASTASADSLSVTGDSAPAVATGQVLVGETYEFDGDTSTVRAEIDATIKPAVHGAACASSPATDVGRPVTGGSDPRDTASGFPLFVDGPGPFLANAHVSAQPGNWLLCFWLVAADQNGTLDRITATTSTLLRVVPVRVTLTLHSRSVVRHGHALRVRLGYRAYNAEQLILAELPSRVTYCGASFSAAPPGTHLLFEDLTRPGLQSDLVTLHPRRRGTLRLCGWIVTRFAPHRPDAGPVRAAVSVV